jgi:hypothetical protein
MKLKVGIIGIFLIVSTLAPAMETVASVEWTERKHSSVPVFFQSVDPTVMCDREAGTGPSSDKKSSSDRCSGFVDLDPETSAGSVAGKVPLFTTRFYLPTKQIALTDPSYPINKPPQH